MSKTATKVLEQKLVEVRECVMEGQRWRHSKTSGEYEIVAVGIWEATGEVSVVYRAAYGDRLVWIRTAENFLEEVKVDGERVGRFVLMKEVE